MGKRKITILDQVVEEIARTAFYIEGEGLPQTAKKFVDEAFKFFEHLSNEKIIHRPCSYPPWNLLNYRCANFHKKYSVAYLDSSEEIIICDFALQKLLKSP
jgi:hypothetical protein